MNAASKNDLTIIRVVYIKAYRADAMAERGIGMFSHILFKLLPVPFIISNSFTVRADRDDPEQGIDCLISMLQFPFFSLQLPHYIAQFIVELAYGVEDAVVGQYQPFSNNSGHIFKIKKWR